MKLKLQILIASLLFTTSGYAQIQNDGNMRMHSGSTVGVFGDFTNNGTFTNNLGTMHVAGSNSQTFDGTNVIHTNNLTINKSSNSLQLDNELQIGGALTFTNGKIESDHADVANEFVHFLDGSSHTGSSDASHIDGVVRKTGNTAFTFPIGDNSYLRTAAISAPGDVADHFTAYYTEADPDGLYSRSAVATNLNHVSQCEYWMLDRTGGSSNVEVSLSWDVNSCGVGDLCDLRVAHWDGSEWTSEGNGGTTGSLTSGTLVSGSGCSSPATVNNFSPFTLGSSSFDNELPIELVFFQANRCNDEVCLSWQTESEINNDFFSIERSEDAISFETIGTVEGAGNSVHTIDYSAVDEYPLSGVSYYRLKQTDFDGESSYSTIRAVEFNGLEGQDISVYPNPTSSIVTIKGKSSEIGHFRIYNVAGQEVSSAVNVLNQNTFKVQLDVTHLSPGIYTIVTESTSKKIHKQ